MSDKGLLFPHSRLCPTFAQEEGPSTQGLVNEEQRGLAVRTVHGCSQLSSWVIAQRGLL